MAKSHPAPSLVSPRPNKRQRLESAVEPVKHARSVASSEATSTPFKSVPEIRAALKAQNLSILVTNVIALRDHFSLKSTEVPAVADARLALVVDWLGSGGAQDVEDIWEQSHKQSNTFAALLTLQSAIFHLLRPYPHHHSCLTPLATLLLSDRGAERLNRAVMSDDASLVLASMKLWVEMSLYEEWQSKVATAWNWGGKAGSKLLNMRRKGKFDHSVNPFYKPDIRTLYTLFLLSFLSPSTPPPLKQSFLAQKDTFTTVFRDLVRDHVEVVRRVFEACWDGIWEDRRIRKTTKIGIFGEWVLGQIAKLYDRTDVESTSCSYSPADLGHHFLLAVCTRPGFGVCFKDAGWYPRESSLGEEAEAEEEDRVRKDGNRLRTYNKILGNFLKTLRVGENSRQQELALKILEACPELVAGFWSYASLTFEPRLSSRWISNVSFLGRVVSLPVPVESFRLRTSPISSAEAASVNTSLSFRPNPPPLVTLLANTMPSVLNRSHLSKGLLSKKGVVQLFSAQALIHCLDKLDSVRNEMRLIEDELGEDSEEGQWSIRRRELEREVRRRAPEFSVIVAFSQQKYEDDGEGAAKRRAMLTEAALRLLWCYQRSLPDVLAETRFDVGKLFLTSKASSLMSSLTAEEPATEDSPDASDCVGLGGLAQLHVLRLLRSSDQFAWSNKAGSTSNTYLYHILRVYVKTDHSAIREVSGDLINHLLGRSVLFEHDPCELDIWLESLPRLSRGTDTLAPDGNVLTDEAEGVVAFLDNCVQRCLGTPYHYYEEGISLGANSSSSDTTTLRPETLPSPLLMAVFEQLAAKRRERTHTPSDLLALVVFIRKLALGLLGKQLHMSHAHRIAARLFEIVVELDVPVSGTANGDLYPGIRLAVQRELLLLTDCLGYLEKAQIQSTQETSQSVQDFLSETEAVPLADDKLVKKLTAARLVGWLRFVDHPLHSSEILRLIRLVDQWSPDGIEVSELVCMLNPKTENLWRSVPPEEIDGLSHTKEIPLATLYLHTDRKWSKTNAAATMGASLAKLCSANSASVLRAVRLIIRRIDSMMQQRDYRSIDAGSSLKLIAAILRDVPLPTREELKALVFIEDNTMQTLLSNGDHYSEDITELVESGLDPRRESDISLATRYCQQCAADLHSYVDSPARTSLNRSSMVGRLRCWIPYMSPPQALEVLDAILEGVKHANLETDLSAQLCSQVLSICLANSDLSTSLSLQTRVNALLAICSSSGDDVLQRQIGAVRQLGVPSGYNGLLESSTSIYKFATDTSLRWQSVVNRGARSVRSFRSVYTMDSVFGGISAPLLYRTEIGRRQFAQRLGSVGASLELSAAWETLLRPIHAMLEVMLIMPDGFGQSEFSTTLTAAQALLPRLVDAVFSGAQAHDVLHLSAACLIHVAKLGSPSAVAESIRKWLPIAAAIPFNSHSLRVLSLGMSTFPEQFAECTTHFVDSGLRWVVRRFSEDESDTEDLLANLEHFEQLFVHMRTLKGHLVEPLLTAILRSRFLIPHALRLAYAICNKTDMHSDATARHLETILQHPHFIKACSPGSLSTRNPLVKLIRVLYLSLPRAARLHVHMQSLSAIYGGSLSVADRQLLSMFRLFEQETSSPIAFLFSHTRGSASVRSGSSLTVLLSLDALRVFRTCLDFPLTLNFDNECEAQMDRPDQYDPSYVLSLYGTVLASHSMTGLEWVQVCRTNIIAVAITALASRKAEMRQVAAALLTATWMIIQETSFYERDQLVYNLRLVRNLLSTDPIPLRLPLFTVLFAAYAVHSLFHPAVLVFPQVSRFLLQRPALDPYDVPLLYGMLYSSSEEWRKERHWIVRFVGNAMKSTADWRAMRRRRTWDLLASLFQAEDGDKPLRQAIFDVLASLTNHQHATHSLILRSSLLSWVEIQLLSLKPQEGICWLRLLENVVMIVDAEKVEQATRGAWRSELSRCVMSLVGAASALQPLSSLELLSTAARLLLRTTALATPLLPHAGGLVALCVQVLKKVEASLTNVPVPKATSHLREGPGLHRTLSGMTEELSPGETGTLWAECVRTLWKFGMSCNEKAEEAEESGWWAELTCRLVGMCEAGGDEGEWARKEIMKNIVQGSIAA